MFQSMIKTVDASVRHMQELQQVQTRLLERLAPASKLVPENALPALARLRPIRRPADRPGHQADQPVRKRPDRLRLSARPTSSGERAGLIRPAVAIIFALTALLAAAPHSNASTGAAAGTTSSAILFELTDEPGRWFWNTGGPIAGTQSLAVVSPGTEVKFTGKSHTVHTMTTLLC